MAIYKWFPIRVTGVTLDTNLITLTTAGDTQQLTATVSPANAEDKSVVWSSDDTNVATVSQNGLVTCVTPGNCNITVTTNDGGYTADCGVSDGSGWQPGVNTILYCPLDSVNLYADVTGNHTMNVNTNYGGASIDSTGFYYFNGGFFYSENYTGPSQGTLSAWFKKEDKGTPSTEWAVSTHRGNSAPYHTFAMNLGNNDTFTYVYTSNNQALPIYPGNQPIGQWLQWTLTYSATDGQKLYINGNLVDSTVANGGLYLYNYPTCIGGSSAAPDQYYLGYIADVVYEDKVWTSGEVAIWYNQSKTRYGL